MLQGSNVHLNVHSVCRLSASIPSWWLLLQCSLVTSLSSKVSGAIKGQGIDARLWPWELCVRSMCSSCCLVVVVMSLLCSQSDFPSHPPITFRPTAIQFHPLGFIHRHCITLHTARLHPLHYFTHPLISCSHESGR